MDDTAVVSSDETATAADVRRFKIVSIVAAVLAAPFVIAHVFIGAYVATMEAMFADMGGEIGGIAGVLVVALGHNGVLPLVLLAVDVAVFVLMYRLAKRYWIGLLFAPILAYMGISSIVSFVLYMPLFDVITLIE